MRRIPALIMIVVAAVAGQAAHTPPSQAQTQSGLACIIMRGDHESAATRSSPLDSASFSVTGSMVKVCYGRPSARGRTIFGGLVPYDELWRTGANEPTMIHTAVALDIGGIRVEPGTYSVYTVPGVSEWQIIVNRSTDQWGRENRYTDEVRAQEVDRTRVGSESSEEYVETFTIRASESDDGNALLVLEWEETRVSVPISGAE